MRDTVLVSAGLAAVAWAGWPSRPRLMLGVVGGGLLMAVAVWALGGLVAGPGGGGGRRGAGFVRFFARHAILALLAYGMMVRLHLDPIGMLVGVSSVVVAVAATAARPR